MAGVLTANSSNAITFAAATIDLNVTFDQSVTLDLACSETSNVQIGFAGTDIGIGPGPVPDIFLNCGNSLMLSVGTYDISLRSEAVTNLGGLASLDFDNALTVSAVPIPAAVWLFGSALAGLGWLRQKQIA
jgi:hypothetical protein